MKTLREVLLEKHQAAEPKLDAIREQVIAGLARPEAPIRSKRMARWQPDASAFQSGWRQLLWSLRWHLAGLSAVWLVVVALNIDHYACSDTRGGPAGCAVPAAIAGRAARKPTAASRADRGARLGTGPGAAETCAVAPEPNPTVLHGSSLICSDPEPETSNSQSYEHTRQVLDG